MELKDPSLEDVAFVGRSISRLSEEELLDTLRDSIKFFESRGLRPRYLQATNERRRFIEEFAYDRELCGRAGFDYNNGKDLVLRIQIAIVKHYIDQINRQA